MTKKNIISILIVVILLYVGFFLYFQTHKITFESNPSYNHNDNMSPIKDTGNQEIVQSEKIKLPIGSKEEACAIWDAKKLYGYSNGELICDKATDKGDYWEISSYSPAKYDCSKCTGKINKKNGVIEFETRKNCITPNTCIK